MHKYVKELVGGSLIYGLSGMISSAIMLFLVPIYTRVFSPADYGVLNLVNITYFLLTIFVIFGLDNSVSLWYWDKTEDDERKKTFASWAYFSLAFSSVVAILITFFSKYLAVLLLNDGKYYILLNLMAFSLVFACLQKVANTWFRVRKKPVWAMIYALVVSLTTIGLSILLVVRLDFGLPGVYWAQFGAAIVCFIFSIILMNRWLLPRHFDLPRLREMLWFAVPLIPATLSFWLMNSAGSYFIQYYVDKTEVGLYQLGNSLASVVVLATGAFTQAWAPFAFSIAKQENHREVYANVFLIYVYIGSLLVFCVFLFSPEVLRILAPKEYSGASFVAGMISLNILILSFSQFVSIGCNLAKTNVPYSIATMIGAVITVLLFYSIIPVWGKEGAALATILGNLFVFGYVFVKSQKLYFVPYQIKMFVLPPLVITVISIFILKFTDSYNLTVSLPIKFVSILSFCLVTFFVLKNKFSKLVLRME